jgi:hypothetical protein
LRLCRAGVSEISLVIFNPFVKSAKTYENGANAIRTRDLLHAMQALSHLSYGPENQDEKPDFHDFIMVIKFMQSFSLSKIHVFCILWYIRTPFVSETYFL